MDKLISRSYKEVATKTKGWPHSFSVLQFNTLADYLAVGDFPHTDPKVIAWDYRKNNLISVITEHEQDFVCLQEVDHFNFFWRI